MFLQQSETFKLYEQKAMKNLFLFIFERKKFS